MPTDESFLAAVAAAPSDHLLRLVYADWLDERADPRGEYLRLSCELATLPRRPTKKRKACEERFTKLRTGIDPAWRTAVAVTFDDDAWRKVLSPLNQALDKVDWTRKAVREKPGGVYQKSQAALLRLLKAYEFATPPERADMRGMVPEFDHFFCATAVGRAKTPAETVRRVLIKYALVDQNPDARDAVLSLQELAEKPGIPLPLFAALRREVAEMASDRNPFGFGSTRSHLMHGYSNSYGARGAPDPTSDDW